MAGAKVTVEVGGRTIALSNLEKVLYPRAGFTKGEVIDYYVAVADALLPHLTDRILTRKRWPDGTESQPFFEKNAPRGTPTWVRTVLMAEHGDDGVDYVVADQLATLVWLANLAALELHVPQWKVDGDDRPLDADLLVFDLDPGPPADIIDCFDVAFPLRELLAADGLTAFPKTSGNKGAQLYVPIEPIGSDKTSAYAKRMAERLESALPDLVLSSMDKKARRGKVFIDWSQNNGAKTTVAPYSLRGVDRPTVSTPLTWDEAADASSAIDLRFESADVVSRLEEHGDLFGDLDAARAPLPVR
jgi:bifunctional non-homologous end joining protein LigD